MPSKKDTYYALIGEDYGDYVLRYEKATDALKAAYASIRFRLYPYIPVFAKATVAEEKNQGDVVRREDLHIIRRLGIRDVIRIAALEGSSCAMDAVFSNNASNRMLLAPRKTELTVNSGDGCNITDMYSGKLWNSGNDCDIISENTMIVVTANNCTIQQRAPFSVAIVKGMRNRVMMSGGSLTICGKATRVYVKRTGAYIHVEEGDVDVVMRDIKYVEIRVSERGRARVHTEGRTMTLRGNESNCYYSVAPGCVQQERIYT